MAGQRKSFCVSCHKTLPTKTFIGKTSHEWEESIHSKAGVTCEQCHGGDPSKEDKDLAHVDVLVSANPKSKIYFKRVPETCGNCHRSEYLRFRKSLHYVYLEKSGRGPNCVTCHGSMDTSVIVASEVKDFCKTCHNQMMNLPLYVPEEAFDTLVFIEQAKVVMTWAKEFMKLTEKAGKNQANIEKAKIALRKAEGNIDIIKKAWHSFELQNIKKMAKEAFDLSVRAKEEMFKP